MEANPNVTIEREVIAYADLKKSLLQSAGAASLPDIVIINSPDHQQFAELGIAANLDERLAEWGQLDQYPEGLIASATYEDSVYGLPISANCLAMYYNPEMLEAAGVDVPTTWAEMEDAAAALTTPEHYGFAYSAINNQQAVFQFLPALWQSGGDLYDLESGRGRQGARLLGRPDGLGQRLEGGAQLGPGRCGHRVRPGPRGHDDQRSVAAPVPRDRGA